MKIICSICKQFSEDPEFNSAVEMIAAFSFENTYAHYSCFINAISENLQSIIKKNKSNDVVCKEHCSLTYKIKIFNFTFRDHNKRQIKENIFHFCSSSFDKEIGISNFEEMLKWCNALTYIYK